MSASLALGLVFHQHQPVGNFDHVFEELFQRSYEPLLACLERHPRIKASLHYSGPLIDWLDGHHPAYLERVGELIRSGQVEIVGGGYYEPILPSIIEEDRIGQLAKMRAELDRRYGVRPIGAWIAERVWEPQLPAALEEAGYQWTLVDDVHFEACGIREENIRGWYLTEAEGHAVGVFASSTQMRYLVPWKPVEECIAFLRERADRNPGSIVVMGDDGEKFGGWPTTYEHCWENGWVDRWLEAIEQESEWLETVTLSAWRDERPPEHLIYLPTMSYLEMGKWSLPADAQQALERAERALEQAGEGDDRWLLRGGAWRNFLVRYPEANLMQKRAMALSKQAREARNADAIEHVWAAECNCPYWHGVFGGVYLEHIRHANFGHLAAADALLFPGPQAPEIRDWDFDGRDEAGLRSDEHFVLVAPATASILQWELRRAAWNLTHVVALRPEAYHAQLSRAVPDASDELRSIHGEVEFKDPEVEGVQLRYDSAMRVAAQDTVLPLTSGRTEYGHVRGTQPIEVVEWTALEQTVVVSYSIDGKPMRKEIQIGGDVDVAYESNEELRLFSEWNLSVPTAHPTIESEHNRLRIRSGDLTLEASHNATDVWWEQVRSVSNSEGGLELAPQGWCIVFAGELGPNQEPFTIQWSAKWRGVRAVSDQGA